ncbi:hypothetical protein [Paenibacillus sp. Y412MC10]|uniref:hypothetical protein n=1 Tax=Geobacillus sp. (strain Y412MC10) TaxID=481743 RepID=UPI0011A6289A|nr:hypothetical protein [Paenibacillus sp. Y412MC10]
MGKMKIMFPEGIIKIKVMGEERLAEFMGRQDGFECVICGKGSTCYTFNLFESVEKYRDGEYETYGFGRNHLNHVELIGQVKPAKVNMTYKGFEIHEETCTTTGSPHYMIYTKEERAFGKGGRSSEWDASSLEEAKQVIDSYYDMVRHFD